MDVMDKFSVSELISFLKSSFQSSDFDKVERVLRLREKKMKDLEDEINKSGNVEGLKLKETLNREVNLEEELEVCISRYNELFVEFEKKKMECVEIQGKFRVICQREKRANERITNLEVEIKKMGSYEREKFVQFKTEIRDLECGKIRAENEIEVWKKKCRELETRVFRLEEEDSSLRYKDSHVFGNVELEPGGLQDEICHTDEGKKDRIEMSKFQSEKNGGTDDGGSNHPPSLKACRSVHVTGPPSIDIDSIQSEKKITLLEPNVEVGNRARKQLIEVEESSNKEVAPLKQYTIKPASGGIIEIVDSDDEKEITPKHIHNITVKEMVHVSTDNALEKSSDTERDLTSKKCLKRPCSDQRGEKHGSCCEEEDIPFSSTPKRRRASKIVTSESECEDDDGIPISKLRMKKLEELNEGAQKHSHMNPSTGNITFSTGSQNIEESITPSRRRLISLRQYEEKKGSTDNESTSPKHLAMGGKSQEKGDSPTAESAKENVAEEDDSDSEGESSGGFIVKGSDCSDSEDSCSGPEDAAEDMDFTQVIAMIKRNKDREVKWQFEADMLSSFEEDPELCMKAVCALYRQQTSEEKSMKGCLHYNKRGFNKFDALRGTNLAEFLMDGDREGDLKKSVKELEMYDTRGLDECQRLARHYSKQLFTIFKNKEDPFFLPP